MMIAADMNLGRRLDEACNKNNDKYDDEVLYTAWVGMRPLGQTLKGIASSAQEATSNVRAAFSNLFYAIRD